MPQSSTNAPLSRDDRILGSIIGQFLGDALCLGSHWHYDFAKRDAAYPNGIHGFEQPIDGHYHAKRRSGDFTHYGDAGLVLLQSVAARGCFDHRDYGRRLIDYFSNPNYPGYLDKATKGTIANAHAGADFDYQQGADDMQTITISRAAPVVALHARDPELAAVIARAVRVCQDNDEAVASTQFYAEILRRLLAGEAFRDAVENALALNTKAWDGRLRDYWHEAQAMQNQSVSDATGEFGRACYLKSTLPSCLHAALKHGDDARTALLETARAGGDNASRACVVGAWLGALHGLSGLPADWLDRLNAQAEVMGLAQQVAAISPQD